MSAKDHVFTIGIEEEFQIIDPETRELRSHIRSGNARLADDVIEVNTCPSPCEAGRRP
jgi:gamma-glutamyl:cysteine ligase YbdK (ATP-grasp superfamily)